MRESLTLLADRRFALLFSARTISILGTAISPVALAFAVLDVPGATATTLGLVLAADYVPTVLFLLVGGVIADRLPRYRVMVSADLAAGLSYAVLAVLFLTDQAHLPVVMALAALHGTASALFFPALQGIVPQVAPADRLQSANGLLRLSLNGSRIAGLALAGALVAGVGPGWALAIDAATYVVSALLLAGIRVSNTRLDAGTSMLADLRHGWREFRSREWLWVIVLQFSVVNAAFTAGIGVLGPVLAKRSLGGATAWSLILAAEAVGMVAGVLVAIRLRPSRPMLAATLAMFPTAGVFALLGAQAPVLVIAATALVAGVCVDIFSVLWETTMQQQIPSDMLSRLSAYDALGSMMLGPIGLLIAGPAADLFGLEEALYGCAALIVVPTALALLSPSVRTLPAGAPAAASAPEPAAA